MFRVSSLSIMCQNDEKVNTSLVNPWSNSTLQTQNAAAKIRIYYEMHKKSREKVHFFPTDGADRQKGELALNDAWLHQQLRAQAQPSSKDFFQFILTNN